MMSLSNNILLIDAGSITHDQAMKKAEAEYRKYKAKTLSDVENDYLDSIRAIEDKAKTKISEKNKMRNPQF